MELTPHKFEDLSSLTYSIFTCPLPTWYHQECLVVNFQGECGHGCQGNGDAEFMAVIVKAASAAWKSVALILDLRQLKYEWGDLMTRPLVAFRPFLSSEIGLLCAFNELPELVKPAVGTMSEDTLIFPTAVVVSKLNRQGLTSLVKEEMGKDPDEVLFDSLEAALTSVDHQLQCIFKLPQQA